MSDIAWEWLRRRQSQRHYPYLTPRLSRHSMNRLWNSYDASTAFSNPLMSEASFETCLKRSAPENVRLAVAIRVNFTSYISTMSQEHHAEHCSSKCLCQSSIATCQGLLNLVMICFILATMFYSRFVRFRPGRSLTDTTSRSSRGTCLIWFLTLFHHGYIAETSLRPF